LALLGIARLGDTAFGACSGHQNTVAWTGVITRVSSGFTVDGVEAATLDDGGDTSCGHTFRITGGSAILTAPNGKKVGRVTDLVTAYASLVSNTPLGIGTITSGSTVVTSE
jgi:uncharacterized Zn-binding protein involved in type VI secretion